MSNRSTDARSSARQREQRGISGWLRGATDAAADWIGHHLCVTVDGDDEDPKRRAVRLFRRAGREHLTPLGATANRSGRYWTIDRGWWLVNIEFQPSSWSVGSYLNVGVQHLWHRQDSRTFGYSSRQQIDGFGQFVDLDGDADEARAATDALARSANRAARQWLDQFADDRAHLTWIAARTTDAWEAFDAAWAYVTLGDAPKASGIFGELATRLDRNVAWQAELATDCERLAAVNNSTALQDEATQRIGDTRQLLKLPT